MQVGNYLHKWLVLLPLLILTVFLSHGVHAQRVPLFFTEVDIYTDKGPNSENITVLLRSSEGYLWIGTQNGLKRYDGHYSVSVGNGVNNGVNSDFALLQDGFITALSEDLHTGNIWIGTRTGGLHILDPKTLSIKPFHLYDNRFSEDWGRYIREIYTAQDSSIWIGTEEDGGMHYRGFNEPPSMLYGILKVSLDSTISVHDFVEIPGSDHMLVAVANSVFSVGMDASIFQAEEIDAISETMRDGEEVSSFEYVGEHIWIATSYGRIFKWQADSQMREIVDLNRQNGVIRSIADLEVSGAQDKMWIATLGGGVYALDFASESIIEVDQVQEGRLTSNQVTALEEGSGVLWAGTFEGLHKAEIDGIRFNTIRAAEGTALPCGQSLDSRIMSLYQAPTEPGILWLGMMTSGLQRYDVETGEVTPYFVCGEAISPIFSMFEDRAGRFWLGNEKSKLYQLDRSNMRLTSHAISEKSNIQILQISELSSSPGTLWLTTDSEGLFAYDIEADSIVKQYNDSPKAVAELSSNKLWFAREDPRSPNVLWVGTKDRGLNRIDLQTDEVRFFDTSSHPCLPGNRIVSIEILQDSTLWLGTFGNGLVEFNPTTGNCTRYGATDGLLYDDVGGIQSDRFGRLWLLSTEGLTLFNPTDTTFTPFTGADGLQPDMFLYLTQFKNMYGELFFGGIGGFNSFHPDSIQISQYTPPVVFSEVAVMGERRSHKSQPLQLSYLESDLSFRFSTMDMRRSGYNQYRVRLLPGNEEWTPAPGGVSPRYALLAPGGYTLEVMGTNSYGAWNSEPSRYFFEIDPPFWKTWWFWTIGVIGLVCTIVGAYQYRLFHLRQEESNRERIANDLHDQVGAEMTNLALRLEWLTKKYDLTGEIETDLIKLADGERDLVEELRLTVWLVNGQFDKLPALVERMEQLKNTMLQGLRCQFRKPSDLAGIELKMVQRKQIMLIYKEALHNIVRHSEATGVEIDISINSKRFVVRIEDNGIGFDTQSNSMGLGLGSMQKRAKEIQAKLSVKSRIGEGTLVELDAPLKLKGNWIQVLTRL